MPLIECYERIALSSDAMLAAAMRGDWDALVEAELECKRRIDVVRTRAHETLSPDDAQRRDALIHRLLNNDARIRTITEPWVARLESMILGRERARRVAAAYC